MAHSRREFLTKAAATVGAASITLPASASQTSTLSADEILAPFNAWPGEASVKIYSPAVNGRPQLLAATANSAKTLVVGSVIKTFILCEALRQADSPNVVQTLSERELALDASVWNVPVSVFNPPHLSGKISERSALEAMIMHSDNTATDMCLKQIGTDKVRAFIASAGLKNTLIPDSTRVYIGYLLNAPNYKTFSWADLMKAHDNDVQLVNSPLNDKESLAASADDLISYYSRALQGEFFQHKQTLTEFRRILSIAEDIAAIPLPLGVSSFVKGGNVDIPGFHAASTAGAMAFNNRWVYFCFTCNWKNPGIHDPATLKLLASTVAQALDKVKAALS